MFQIKPLHSLTRSDIRELAHAAADRGEPLDQANPFPPDSTSGINFQNSYQERESQLCEA